MLSLKAGRIERRRASAAQKARFSVSFPNSTEFPPGSVVPLCGRSGSGKSTFLQALAGFRRGLIVSGIHESSWGRAGNRVPVSQACAYLTAHPSFFPTLPVLEYLRLSAFKSRPRDVVTDKEIASACDRFMLSDHLLARFPADLSSGERQRVGLARVSLQLCPVVLLDEPRANLDVEAREVLDAFFAQVASDGGVVLYATHNEHDWAGRPHLRLENHLIEFVP